MILFKEMDKIFYLYLCFVSNLILIYLHWGNYRGKKKKCSFYEYFVSGSNTIMVVPNPRKRQVSMSSHGHAALGSDKHLASGAHWALSVGGATWL